MMKSLRRIDLTDLPFALWLSPPEIENVDNVLHRSQLNQILPPHHRQGMETTIQYVANQE